MYPVSYTHLQTYGEKAVSVTQYTMSEIVAAVYNKMEETGLKEGILFIDEINCVSETLAPAMLQFLQYKTFGNHKIPDGWIIAAAGNPPEFNKSVREFDIATLDRVKQIFVEPDFAVWKEYAVRMEVHPAILSYLTARPQNFCQVETTVDAVSYTHLLAACGRLRELTVHMDPSERSALRDFVTEANGRLLVHYLLPGPDGEEHEAARLLFPVSVSYTHLWFRKRTSSPALKYASPAEDVFCIRP